MPKIQRRKPPKRKPRKPNLNAVDHDLLELAIALDEFRMERNTAGWFTLPWRDGRNAVLLACETANLLIEEICDVESLQEAVSFAADAARGTGAIERSDLYRNSERWIDRLQDLPPSRARIAATCAARCIGRWSTDSDGGGHAYNTWLRQLPTVTERIVIQWRCHDAIGVGPQLKRDKYDSRRQAFVLAWKRGLFHTAYALPPIILTRK